MLYEFKQDDAQRLIYCQERRRFGVVSTFTSRALPCLTRGRFYSPALPQPTAHAGRSHAPQPAPPDSLFISVNCSTVVHPSSIPSPATGKSGTTCEFSG
nr:hypothetical protein Iba_chr14aCG17270 [Ipomoea batatas]